MEEVDFGCILNDTETIRCITMTNSSPLEVRYGWSFLKRPPVQRVPDQDEGVDMESECETDSLDEEEEGSEKEDGEGGEKIVSEGEDGQVKLKPHGSHIQIADDDVVIGSHVDIVEESSPGEQSPEEASSPGNEVAPEEDDPSGDHSSLMSEEQPETARDDEVIESGLPPGESEVDMEAVAASLAAKSEGKGVSSDGVSETKQKGKREPQPWELTYDPFTPISIEQVSRHRMGPANTHSINFNTNLWAST